MKISVDFANGDIAEYDFSTFTSPDPFRYTVEGERADRNLCTELRLRTGMLRTGEGLAVDIFFNTLYDRNCLKVDRTDDYNSLLDEEEPETPPSRERARRRGGDRRRSEYKVDLGVRRVSGVINLLNKSELAEAEYILVRRCDELTPVAWRQGSKGWLIDGQAWVRASREVYSDAMTTSRNAQELIMVNYLQNAYPERSIEEICAFTGFPVEAYLEIRELEMRNAADAIGGQGLGGGPAGPGGDPDGEDDALPDLLPDLAGECGQDEPIVNLDQNFDEDDD